MSLVPARAWAEIDLSALQHNVTVLREFLGESTALMAVVKADAYGHGLVPAARRALESGAQWLGVATALEGEALRLAGIEAPIALLCAPAPTDTEILVKNRLTAMVGDPCLIEMLVSTAAQLGMPVPDMHLDIDTGIGRAGSLPAQAAHLVACAREAGVQFTGVMTHFADADGPLPDLTHAQIQRLADLLAMLNGMGEVYPYIHASASAAIARFPEAQFSLVRPGLLTYGIMPPIQAGDLRPGFPALRPVLSLKAQIGSVRSLPVGHTISYGATHRLARPSRVATVLIGYGDGYPRRLSNQGSMLIRGRRAPILGRVCMDQAVVDVTDIPDAAPGDIAVCIGSDGNERISVEEIAALTGATEHEITTCISDRVPRVYVE